MRGEDKQTTVNSIVPQHEIILYRIDDTNICINVIFEDEIFWLSKSGMAELFDVNSQVISKHLSNIYEEEELQKEETCSKKERVQNEGNRTVKRKIDYYNLTELMAEDEILMSMKDWVEQTDVFLKNNRRNVLSDKGRIFHEKALEKATNEYKVFRVKQDEKYILEFDKQMGKYLKGE